jgi:hypothetical protein
MKLVFDHATRGSAKDFMNAALSLVYADHRSHVDIHSTNSVGVCHHRDPQLNLRLGRSVEDINLEGIMLYIRPRVTIPSAGEPLRGIATS